MLSNLITDRTSEDVQRFLYLRDKGINNMTASELEEWNGGLKGAYNTADLNRVGAALNYVKDRLTAAGYLGGNEFYLRTDWDTSEIVTAKYFSEYLGAVRYVRDVMTQYSTTPPAPVDTGSLDYQGANDIEKILLDIDELITKMFAARYFCGELFSGEI